MQIWLNFSGVQVKTILPQGREAPEMGVKLGTGLGDGIGVNVEPGIGLDARAMAAVGPALASLGWVGDGRGVALA